MMDTLTQVERLIELAIIQRSELRRLVEELPQLKAHLSEEIERTFEETEPQLRAELEEWTTKQTADKTAALGVALEAKIADLAKSLEVSTQARYNAIIAEREENARLAAEAEAKIAEHAASLPSAVKDIVTAELARFPRAGEIDQLRKEFAEPKSLNPRGKWVAGETYNKLDLVTINGDSYVSNIDGNTEKPSRSAGNWTLNAARGNSGGGGGITALNDLLGNPSAGDIVGSEGNNYVRKTLTAGTGITITDDPSTITIDASGAQEILTATVKNAESVAITRGQVVYLFSATGGFPSVKLAYNTSDATSAKTFGVVSDVSIAPNGTGTITCVGVVSNLNLGAYNDGDTVYLGATPGSFTATKPYAPNHLVYVGIIERANAGNGELYVRVQNGYELDEIHDVQINAPKLAGQTLIYDETNDLWKNARLTGTANQITVTNADAAVTLSIPTNPTLAGNLTVSGGTATLGSDASLVRQGNGWVQIANTSGSFAFGGYSVTTNRTDNYVGLRAINNTGGTSFGEFGVGSTATGDGLQNYGYIFTGAGLNGIRLFTNGSTTAKLTIDNAGLTTLAGNLTASGTGASSFAGRLSISSTTGVGLQTALAVSSSSGLGVFTDYTKTSGTSRTWSLGATGSSSSAGDNAFALYDGTAAAFRFLVTSGGNFLLGTTTDSANGKVQLATHTTSAGGIGFGTDTSLYRTVLGQLALNSASGGYASLGLYSAGSSQGQLATSGNQIYLDSGANLYLRTNGSTTALTLASDQSAQFQNTVTLYTVGASSTGQNSLIFTGADGNGNVRTPAKIIGKHAGNGGYGNLVLQTAFNNSLVDALTLDSSQRCILSGALRLANTYVATPQVSTGYVTIQDSTGTTYKVLVAT